MGLRCWTEFWDALSGVSALTNRGRAVREVCVLIKMYAEI